MSFEKVTRRWSRWPSSFASNVVTDWTVGATWPITYAGVSRASLPDVSRTMLSACRTGTPLLIKVANVRANRDRVMLSISGHYARNDQNMAMAAILGTSALIVILAWYYHDDILRLVKKKKD